MRHLWEHKKRLWMVLADIVLAVAAYLLANLFRFEGDIPGHHVRLIWRALPFLLLLRIAAFTGFGLYRGIWAYASISDLITLIKAVTAGSAAFAVALFFLELKGHSRAVLVLDWLILIFLVGGTRLSLRLCQRIRPPRGKGILRVLVIGAGDAGEMVLRELQQGEHHTLIVRNGHRTIPSARIALTRLLHVPSGPVGPADLLQHRVVLGVHVDAQLVVPGDARRVHVVYAHRHQQHIVVGH